MVKTVKSTSVEIRKRQKLILELITYKKDYEMKKSVLVDLNRLLILRKKKPITEATIGRDFKYLGIKKKPGSNYYEYPNEIRKKNDLESLARDLKNHTDRIFSSDIHFLAIPVVEGMADFMGRKIMANFKSLFVGYFPGSDFLLMLTDDEGKLNDATTKLTKLVSD